MAQRCGTTALPPTMIPSCGRRRCLAAQSRLEQQIASSSETLSSSSAEGSLLLSRSQVALLAVGAAMAAFAALRYTSVAADIDGELREATRPRDAEPAPPQIPRLLPAIHVLWQPLMAALQVSDVPNP